MPLLLICLPTASVAQAAPYREGSVWAMTFIRVKSGMGDDWLNNFRATTKRVFEEAKRQGLVLSYKVISTNAANRDDWNYLVLAEYKNMAALDSTDAKARAISAKLIGPPEVQRSLAVKRSEIREIVGTELGRELILRDSTVTASRP